MDKLFEKLKALKYEQRAIGEAFSFQDVPYLFLDDFILDLSCLDRFVPMLVRKLCPLVLAFQVVHIRPVVGSWECAS